MAKRIVVTKAPDISRPADLQLIAQSITHARTLSGLTIEDTAALCGLAKQTYHNMELGKPGCRIDNLLKVMAGLGIEIKLSLPSNNMNL